MTLLTNTAEGGTSGTAVTTANSGGASGTAFSAVAAGVAGGIAFSNAQAQRGSLSYLMQVATAAACTFDMSDTAASTFTIRFYLRLNAYPSATAQGPVGIRSAANASIGRLNLSTTGQLQVVLGTANTTSTFSTPTLALNTWYRLEVYGTGIGTAAASMTCDVYVGNNTGTPYLTTSLTGQNTTANVGIVRFGRISTAGSNDWFVDDIAVNIGSATPLGPSATPGGLAVVFNDLAGGYDTGSLFGIGEVFTDRAGSTDQASSVLIPGGGGGGGTTTGPLSVLVDWAGDGTFSPAPSADDVTDRVRGVVTASYGRDQGSSSPLVAGRGSFDLDNSSRDYSPRNATSPLHGLVRPARPVRITRTVGSTTYTIFRGHTDDSPLSPDVDTRRVSFSLVDYLADFRGVNITTHLYLGIRTGTAIGIVLDALGWTGPRDLDAGAASIPWFWCDGADALDTLQELLASEGSPSMLTIDETGAVVFRDRHHRLIRARSRTSQATLQGSTAAEPVMAPGFTYSEPWGNIVNSVQVSVDERAPAEPSAVWSTTDYLVVPASQSYTVVIQTAEPFLRAVVPVAGTDYTVSAGAISSVTISASSGQSTTVTLTAGAAGATVAGLQLRAQSVPVARTRQVTVTDAASISDYSPRGLIGGAPTWASYYDVQGLAAMTLAQRRQPLPILQVRFVCQDSQTARLNALLSLDLSDRVTVVEPETQVAGDFFVESISHTISSMAEHEIVLGLEAVPAAPTSVFTVGASTLGGPDPLGY